MQDRGIKIDQKKVNELIIYYNDIIAKQNVIKKELGYESLNPRSSKQMQKVFYEDLKMPHVKKRRKDKYGESKMTLTTDTDTLSKWIAIQPLAKCLIEISASEHHLSSFIIPFRDISIHTSEGKILRPNYNSIGTVTGRPSCNKPNLLNISSDDSIKKVSQASYRARECFIPREGYILTYFDYSQIEVWITAFKSNDVMMIDFLMSGGDLHALTGERCFSHKSDYEKNKKAYRKKGKTLNFGSIYGMGVSKLASDLNCPYEEAKDIFDKFWETYEGLNEYRYKLQDEIKDKGYVTNPFGRNYFLPDNMSYKALNYMVQGSAAEVLKRAMINVEESIKNIDANILLNIYDELCIEVSKKLLFKPLARTIVKAMQSNFHEYFNMPNKFSIGVEYSNTNWHEKKDLNMTTQISLKL